MPKNLRIPVTVHGHLSVSEQCLRDGIKQNAEEWPDSPCIDMWGVLNDILRDGMGVFEIELDENRQSLERSSAFNDADDLDLPKDEVETFIKQRRDA